MNHFPSYLLMPLVAAAFYATGALFFKEAFRRGASTLHTFFVTSWIMGFFFAPFIFWETEPFQWNLLHYPVLTALTFFFGHWMTFTAIRTGDVSLVTPIMGTKSIFVALFAWLTFNKAIPAGMWMATLFTALAVYVLGKTDSSGKRHSIPLATWLAIGSAACFGLCDALVQEWAPVFGVKAFLTLMFATAAILTLCLVPFFETPLRHLKRKTWGWMLAGAVLTAQQAILVGLAVSMFHNATGVNVVYSSRGLWAIVLVWLSKKIIGQSLERTESNHLWWRLAGAILMCLAIVLAVMDSPPAVTDGR
ncbi:MAG: DMT family transporter [Verrucomicrobiota bacterium]|nr:DMT family transporter [Verrucomicrobiota bacterium]